MMKKKHAGFTFTEIAVTTMLIGVLAVAATSGLNYSVLNKQDAEGMINASIQMNNTWRSFEQQMGFSGVANSNFPAGMATKSFYDAADIMMYPGMTLTAKGLAAYDAAGLSPMTSMFRVYTPTTTTWVGSFNLNGHAFTLSNPWSGAISFTYGNVTDPVLEEMLRMRCPSDLPIAASNTTGTCIRYGTKASNGKRTVNVIMRN